MLLFLAQICFHVFDYASSEYQNLSYLWFRMKPYDELKLIFNPNSNVSFVSWPEKVIISFTSGETFSQSTYGPYDGKYNVTSFCGIKKLTLNIENSQDSISYLKLNINNAIECPSNPLSFNYKEKFDIGYLAIVLASAVPVGFFMYLGLIACCCPCCLSYNLCIYLRGGKYDKVDTS